jgi:hypothetical protein
MPDRPNPRRDHPYTAATITKYTNMSRDVIDNMDRQGLIEPHDRTSRGVIRYLLGDVLDARKFYKRSNSHSAGVTWKKDGWPVSLTIMCMECERQFIPHDVNTRRLCEECAARHNAPRAATLAEAEEMK